MDPYLSVFAEGYVVRAAAARPHRGIILLGVCLLGLPVVAVGVEMIAIALQSWNVANLLEALPALGMIALWGAIVYKTTRNFIRLRRSDRPGPRSA